MAALVVLVVLALALALATTATAWSECVVNITATNVTHRVDRHYLGCHSDAGYAHQARGLYAELVYGTAFEPVPDVDPTNRTGYQLRSWATTGTGVALDTAASQIEGGSSLVLSASGAAATNRGFGNEGLFLEGGKLYEGFLVLQVSSGKPASVEVRLEQRGAPLGDRDAPLARATLQIPAGTSQWTKVPFTLTPSATQPCVGISDTEVVADAIGCPANGSYTPGMGPMSDVTAHICVRCGGQFTIKLLDAGSAPASVVRVGYASLMPGAWGRFAGLPVRADGAAAMAAMGVSMVRWGGSYTTSKPMPWTRWRGPVWQRPSAMDGEWGPRNHPHAVMSGWGIFEMVDLSAALGATPVLTLDAASKAHINRPLFSKWRRNIVL